MSSFDWSTEPDSVEWAWNAAIDRVLEDPEIRSYYEFETVVLSRAKLRNAMHRQPVVTGVLDADTVYQQSVKHFGARRDTARQFLRQARQRAEYDPLLAWAVTIALVLLFFSVPVGFPWWADAALGSLLATLLIRSATDVQRRPNLITWLNVAWFASTFVWCAGPAAFYAFLWSRTTLPPRLTPVMRQEITRLLGPRRESLLVFRNHKGLIHAHDPQFWVSSHIEEDLKRKLDQMDGGAIAICGPRGAGKSTLLRKSCEGTLLQSVRSPNFHVVVQTPANYKPEEFLVSLFQQVCVRYLKLYGRRARGPFVFRARAADIPRRMIRYLVALGYLILGLAGLFFALRAPAEDLFSWVADAARATFPRLWNAVSNFFVDLWDEHPYVSRAAVVLVSLWLIVYSGIPFWLGRRRHRKLMRRHRKLIADCNSYLHLLRHTQSTSNASTLGLSGIIGITVGGSRTTGLQSRTLSYPELVDHFRELLTRISLEEKDDAWKVFIGIDELDRLGSAEQARAFLAEVKAIFTVPGVYFVLTVSEDIGAAFIRRGMPSRDITDSSLEDVLYVERRDLEDARQLLQQRVPGFTDPFVALVHALAGGIPRDLIRYTRKLVELRHRTGDLHLTSLAGRLLLEEIEQALSSFRVLHGELAHTPEMGPRLHTLHVVTNLARQVDVTEEHGRESFQRALSQLATPDTELSQPTDTDTAPGNWREVASYALFALTLLEVFAHPDFTERAQQQQDFGHPDGDLDVLATIRLEMAISPSSARLMIERFRMAWDLQRHPVPHPSQPRHDNADTPST